MLDIVTMMSEVRQVNEFLGWYDKDVSFPEAIALLHSEVSEALEAYRTWGMNDATIESKPEGVGSEFADILIRLLDYCHRFGVDLETEYVRKIAYNKTRGYRHGGKNL